jgi:carboxymethylenebutenolidase
MPSSWEALRVGGKEMKVYSSMPAGSGPFPAVVVIHSAGGVGQFIEDFNDRLADEGYVAVAPDLLHRVTDDMIADGSRRSAHTSDPQVILDVNTTVEFLRNHAAVDPGRLGITGFCFGGRVCWLMAAESSHFRVAAPFYGASIMVPRGDTTQSPFDRTPGIDCPLMFHFGELDANPSPDDMVKFDSELNRLGKPHEFFTYDGAGHAFMSHVGASYHQPSAELAWSRSLEFFDTHLKGQVASKPIQA